MTNRITQRQVIFYLLYKKFKEGKGEYIPVWQFIGEHYIEEFQKWVFLSYEISARSSELNSMNPGLIDRTRVTGKSGAKYFAYRLAPATTINDLWDEDLKQFYIRLRRVMV